jgi:hypothetical protein
MCYAAGLRCPTVVLFVADSAKDLGGSFGARDDRNQCRLGIARDGAGQTNPAFLGLFS